MPKIICRGCGGMYHETTELFDPTTITNGTMLKLTPPYDTYGWSTFLQDASVELSDLCCPECGAPYPDDDGHVRSMDGPIPAPPVRVDPRTAVIDALMEEYEPSVPTTGYGLTDSVCTSDRKDNRTPCLACGKRRARHKRKSRG